MDKLEALNKILEVVKTEPSEEICLTLPSGRCAKVDKTRPTKEHSEYPKRVHVSIHRNPKSVFTQAHFDFFLYEDGVVETLAMVDRPRTDDEFNNDILKEFYLSINPEWKAISAIPYGRRL